MFAVYFGCHWYSCWDFCRHRRWRYSSLLLEILVCKQFCPLRRVTLSTVFINSTANKTSSVPENGGSTNSNSTVIAATACAVGAFASIARCLCWRRRRSGQSNQSNVGLKVSSTPKRAYLPKTAYTQLMSRLVMN